MPAFHRTFNPYSSAPPPPPSLPDYIIPPTTLEPLSNEEAGHLIDSFLQSQGGKILTIHRLADHLLGRTQAINSDDIKELENVIEEERRREGGVLPVPREDIPFDEEVTMEDKAKVGFVPTIESDKKRARKEERRMKKEKEREKRKRDENLHNLYGDVGKEVKKRKKEKKGNKETSALLQ